LLNGGGKRVTGGMKTAGDRAVLASESGCFRTEKMLATILGQFANQPMHIILSNHAFCIGI